MPSGRKQHKRIATRFEKFLETFRPEEENKTESSVNLCVFSEQLCEIVFSYSLSGKNPERPCLYFSFCRQAWKPSGGK